MKADVVIVGGGIMGLSIAYQLSRRSNLKIIIAEKGAALGEGSTGASSAVCRFRYSFDEMVMLARDGIEAYANWGDFLKLNSLRTRLQKDGVLWMPGNDLSWAQREHERFSALGIRTEVLDDQDLQERFPSLSSCVIAPDLETGVEHECVGGGKHFFEVDGGYVDPVAAAEDLLEACRREGVDVLFNTGVAKVQIEGGKVTGVELQSGAMIHSPVVVSAVGPWTNQLFANTGLEMSWTLSPTRIQVLYLDVQADDLGELPVCVDLQGGIYFRRQNRGQQLVLGSTLEIDEQELVANPDEFDRLVDSDFQVAKLHALHHRLPDLPYKGAVRGYSGLYTINREDVHPILGNTAVDGLVIAAGFSGHGFKIAPAVGSMIAQLISDDTASYDTLVNPEFFAFDRTPHQLESLSVLA